MRATDLILKKTYGVANSAYQESILQGVYPAVLLEKDPKGQSHLFDRVDVNGARTGSLYVSSRKVKFRWHADHQTQYEQRLADIEMHRYSEQIKKGIKERYITDAEERGERATNLLAMLGWSNDRLKGDYSRNIPPPKIRAIVFNEAPHEAWIELPATVIVEICEAAIIAKRRALTA